jgi:hypothetical protein
MEIFDVDVYVYVYVHMMYRESARPAAQARAGISASLLKVDNLFVLTKSNAK